MKKNVSLFILFRITAMILAVCLLPILTFGETAGAETTEWKNEETGFTAEKIQPLLHFYPTVAYSGEKIDIYLARDLQKSERHLDADEFINVEAWDVSDLLELCYNGTIRDAKTVAAVMAYQNGIMSGRF